jgi:hypothetical protein
MPPRRPLIRFWWVSAIIRDLFNVARAWPILPPLSGVCTAMGSQAQSVARSKAARAQMGPQDPSPRRVRSLTRRGAALSVRSVHRHRAAGGQIAPRVGQIRRHFQQGLRHRRGRLA